MKTLPVLAALAAMVGIPLQASAQCPASMAYDAPGAEPVQIILKYSWKLAEVKPTALKTALEKLPIVVRTEFAKDSNSILVKYKGKCEQIASLEAAAKDAGVPAYVTNHAHVSIVLKVQPGANVKGAIDALGKVPGALYAKASGNGLELHADLDKLSMEDISKAVAPFKCEAVVDKTFEFVQIKILEGKPDAYIAAAGNTKGVMAVRTMVDGIIGIWINKAAVKADQLEKIEGFKVKRQ